MINLYVIGAVLVFVAGAIIHNRLQGAKIRKQQQEIESVKREAAAIAQELENANQAKNIAENNRTLSGHDIDKQLHDKGYFRAD